MDTSRKANREDREVTLQYKSPQDAKLLEEQSEENLSQLLEFIARLEQTPDGNAELQNRTKLIGDCKRIEGETSAQFYAKLRKWLDQDIPSSRAPLHAPRQLGDEHTFVKGIGS